MHTLKFWGIICKAYRGIDRGHEAVNHSATQFVHDMEHTNGIESFWVVPKRAHKGVYHKFSGAASSALRGELRWSAQCPGHGHDWAGTHRRRDGRQAAHL